MNRIKFSWKGFYKYTPKKMKNLGYGLLGISQFMAGYALYKGLEWTGWVSMGLGVLSKIITSFFVDDSDESN